MPEPFRMLRDVGMVGRGLERDVERDLELLRPRRPDEPVEIRERAEARIDGRVAAGRGADRPGAARDRPRSGVSVLLRPLRKLRADRMDRRQVDDVEAHRRDVGQPSRRFAERRAPGRDRCRRTREHLVPGAEPRALALDDDAQHARIARGPAAARVFRQPRSLRAARSTTSCPAAIFLSSPCFHVARASTQPSTVNS